VVREVEKVYMKSLIFIFTVFVLVSAIWLVSGFWRFSELTYIDQKVLDISSPFDVKIDIEFLKDLEPAND